MVKNSTNINKTNNYHTPQLTEDIPLILNNWTK